MSNFKNPMADIETPTLKEGVGICSKHNCEMWEVQRSVPSYKSDKDRAKGEHQREYQPRFCPMCQQEKKNNRLILAGASVEGYDSPNKNKETAIEKLARTKGIDITRDVVVKFSYNDELSVVNAENFVSWFEKDLSREKRVKVIKPNRFLETRQRRFMNDESKQKYLKLSHDIETADIVVLDSLADVPNGSMDEINSVLLSTKDDATLVILSIPESDFLLQEMPIKLRFRLKRAQEHSLSSTGKRL